MPNPYFKVVFITSQLFLAFGQSFDCPLSWSQSSFGERVPEEVINISTAIPIAGGISLSIEDNVERMGRVVNGVAYLLTESEAPVKLTSDYSVLSNPFGCTVKWVKGMAPSHLVKYSPSSLPIGRGSISGQIVAGPIKNGRLYAHLENGIQSTSSFETLTSLSPGLSLELTDFVYLDDINAAEETTSFDRITNEGEFELVQTVTNKFRTFDSVSFSFSSMSSRTNGLTLSAHAGFKQGGISLGAGVGLSFSWTKGQGESNANHYSKERWVEVEREVVVGPYTSVTVCSTILMAKEFKSRFIAKGRYSAPGIEGSIVRGILEAEGANIIGQEGNIIVTTEEGEIGGSLGLNTKFIVVPDGENCNFGNALKLLKK